MANTLGISLGTRVIGIAILADGKLATWKVYSFPGAWSEQKLKAILRTIELLIRAHQAGYIAIKIPDTLPSSLAFYKLIGGMNTYFENKDLVVRYYTLSDIKQFHCPQAKASKSQLIDCIVLKYPDLIPLYRRELHNSKPYYTKIFEALAAGRCLRENT